jgi:hypothetical protein
MFRVFFVKIWNSYLKSFWMRIMYFAVLEQLLNPPPPTPCAGLLLWLSSSVYYIYMRAVSDTHSHRAYMKNILTSSTAWPWFTPALRFRTAPALKKRSAQITARYFIYLFTRKKFIDYYCWYKSPKQNGSVLIINCRGHCRGVSKCLKILFIIRLRLWQS